MSECDCSELAESSAIASSSIPYQDVIYVGRGVVSDDLFATVAPPVFESSASAASSLPSTQGVALVLSTGTASSSVFPSSNLELSLEESATSASSLLPRLRLLFEESATASDSVEYSAPQFLESSAEAQSSVVLSTRSEDLLLSQATASDTIVSKGLSELAVETATATDSIELAEVTAYILLTDSSGTGSSAFPLASSTPQKFLLTGEASAESEVFHTLDTSALLVEAAVATDRAIYSNPAAISWVMNTQTTAPSWYTNYDFESIAQTEERTLAVGPDGLYEITGDNDTGLNIDATYKTGFLDFGEEVMKRIDTFYVGYQSQGGLRLQLETPESQHGPQQYNLEERDSTAPRNARILASKGQYGRYWRVEIKNINGADFEVHDLFVDVAVSTRRM